jgi:Tfp pilus assembly protein PilO
MRYIFLLLLIVASVGVFIGFVLPRYHAAQATQATVSSYNANLATATQLEQSRQALITQYNNIPKADLDNIQTLLPDAVNNIRLIIELDALATKNGLSSLRSVDYDPSQIPTAGTSVPAVATDTTTTQLPYKEFDISFQTTGQYSNFLSFLSDLEQNLRLVDVTEIDFLPPVSATGAAPTPASGLSYKVILKTYWLKQ